MRNIHPDVIAALESAAFIPVFFVEILFEEPLRFTSASSSMFLDGVEYFGAGNLGRVGTVNEGTELDPQEFEIVVAGVSESSLAVLDTQKYLNLPAKCLLALLDENGDIIGEPIHYFSGKTDDVTVNFGSVGSITIVVRDELADWARPKIERYTNADQQAKHPTDKGLEHVQQVADKDIVWPASSYF